jgi:hypothetical protein
MVKKARVPFWYLATNKMFQSHEAANPLRERGEGSSLKDEKYGS